MGFVFESSFIVNIVQKISVNNVAINVFQKSFLKVFFVNGFL